MVLLTRVIFIYTKTQTSVIDQLDGEWKNAEESDLRLELTFDDNTVEFKSYYMLNGIEIPGPFVTGSAKPDKDDAFILVLGSDEVEGHVVDENTIVINGLTFVR